MGRAVLALAVSLFLAAASPIQAADLSPAHWSETQRGDLQARELAFWPKAARESHGSPLVTGTASPIAVHAGTEALRQGGSAADAAMVVALTQIARTMGGTVSYAGKLEVAYFDAKMGTVSFLDASWSPYADERDPGSIPDLGDDPASTVLGRQTLVPGFMRGMEALHSRFGRLPWADLFEPAIWYAENGVDVSPAIVGFRQNNGARFARTPEGRRLLTMADGRPAKVGDVIRQPDLARTLRAVARRGADEMYRGSWARDYIDAVRVYGGRATLQDLERYRPRWREPISADFAGATVYGMSTGTLACASLTSLSLLDAMQVASMGPYWKDPVAFRAYARAIQYATLRQVVPPGPTAFEKKAGLAATSCADRLARPYAATLAPELMKNETFPFGEAPVAAPEAGHHTMAVVVVDRKGDVAVLVHSANGAPTGIVVDGVPIPEAATVNKWALAGARAGDLLTNDIAPLIAVRVGRPVVVVGATGTSLMPETVRLMGELLSGHEDLATITAAPPLLYNFAPPKSLEGFAAWPVLAPAGAYYQAFLKRLEVLGVSIKEEPRSMAWTSLRGTAAAAVIAPSGVARAVEVPVIDMFAESES
jgi:gamma-glutamyltranspeptidase/glutathione hydrolase